MRKLLAFLLIGLLGLGCISTASANGWGLPGSLTALFENEAMKDYADYTAAAKDQDMRRNRPQETAVFVMEARYHSELFVAVEGANGWEFAARSTTAVPQPADKLSMTLEKVSADSFLLEITRSKTDTDVWCFTREDGQWLLQEGTLTTKKGEVAYLRQDGGYLVSDGKTNELWAVAPITLSSFDWKRNPATPAQARQMNKAAQLTQVTFPEGTEERAAKQLDAAVYTAPSAKSARMAKNKAAVSLRGGFTLYGQTGDWYLISYPVSVRTSRVGYIAKLEAGDWPCDALTFAKVNVKTTEKTFLTDDPMTSRYAQAKLKKGTKAQLLAVKAPYWGYVETTVKHKTIRGFVPLSALTKR